MSSIERADLGALQVLAHLRGAAPVVPLSDDDMVFQPHKVQRAGIADAVGGQVLIYTHKRQALADVMRRQPARHDVLIDDKPRMLAAIKRQWQQRATTIQPRQGPYAPAAGRADRANCRPSGA